MRGSNAEFPGNGRSLRRTITVKSRDLRTLDSRWDMLDGNNAPRR